VQADVSGRVLHPRAVRRPLVVVDDLLHEKLGRLLNVDVVLGR
jgi:hypothetical protein